MTDRISAVTMPRWGMTMTEGKVTRWLAGEGAKVEAGSELVEIETTKITNVMEAPVSGVLRRVVVGEGGSASVGSVIAVVAVPEAADAEIDAYLAAHASAAEDENGDLPAGPQSRIIEAGPHRLNVLSMGNGPATPAILIHGFGGDLNSWMFNQPVFAEQRPVHALDLPGHGQSSLSYGSGSVRGLAEAVIGLMDALRLAKVHVVGHSMGGAIALLLAVSRPDRIASVTGVAPGGLGAELNRAFIDGFIAADRRGSMGETLGLLFARPEAVSRAMVDDALRYKRQDGSTEALTAIAAANFTPTGQKSGLRELLPAIKAPVQVIWGREDRVIPAAQAAGLPANVAATVLEGAGHMPHMERPTEVNTLLARFMASHDAGGA